MDDIEVYEQELRAQDYCSLTFRRRIWVNRSVSEDPVYEVWVNGPDGPARAVYLSDTC